MANQGHKWQPGESGNPKGRPRKGYALKEALARVGRGYTDTPEGRRVRNQELARMNYDVALNGRTTCPDGSILTVDPKTQVEQMRWLPAYQEPATQTIESSGPDGGPMVVEVVFVNDWRKGLPPDSAQQTTQLLGEPCQEEGHRSGEARGEDDRGSAGGGNGDD